MGGQTKRQFSTKNDATGQKNDFFRNFLFCCTSTHRDETFLFLPKFPIFCRSEISWGDKEKRYINDERTKDERTNDERRTTWTIIIPRQDSQNPRANKHSLE